MDARTDAQTEIPIPIMILDIITFTFINPLFLISLYVMRLAS